MKYRRFGKTGLQVSEIGFGGSRIGGVFAERKGSNEALALLQKAFDAGITFYDTADIYSQGESENLIGRALRNRRDKVILASKAGYSLPTQRKLVARIKPVVRPVVQALGLKRQTFSAGMAGTLSQDFTRASLVRALEGSLRRLRTDYLDLYQLHSPPASFLRSDAFTEALETLESLRQQGKIRFYGVAAESIEEARLGLKYPGLASVQMPFGLLDPGALDSVLLDAAAEGIAVIARGCFGGGLLKETLTEAELKERTPKWRRILDYRRLSEQNGRPILEMALQFALRVPAISVTLLGMRTEKHLAGNLRFYDAPPLDDAEHQRLTELQYTSPESLLTAGPPRRALG